MNYTKMTLKIPMYTPEKGLRIEWEEKFSIKIAQENGCILLTANENGLISLAKLLLSIAEKNVPNHYHIHLDDTNSLEDGSLEIIIEKQNN